MNAKPARRLLPLLAAAAAAALAWLIAWNLWQALPGGGLLDYGSFVASGRAAGAGENPYGIYPLTFHVVLPGFESWNPNLNPPVALPLFQLFDLLPPEEGFRLWWSVSLLCYVATIGLLVWHHRRELEAGRLFLLALWAFALAGFWDTLELGQIYTPLVLAGVGAWVLLARDRPLAAGLLIGAVVAVKPNFLVWPALLLLSGHLRPVLAAGASAAALSLAALLIYGPTVYWQWFELIAAEGERAVFLTNVSLPGLVRRAGIAGVDRIVAVAVLAGLALLAWRRRPGMLQASALGLAGALLASPIAWIHYMLFLLPVFFVRPLPLPLRIAMAVLLVPVPTILGYLGAPQWQQATFGSAYGWAALLCLAGIAWGGGRWGERRPDGGLDGIAPQRAAPVRAG